MTAATLWSANAGDIPANMAFKNNLTAAGAPTVNDDETAGYVAGSVWVHVGTGAYVLIDATAGAASWLAVGGLPVPGTIPAYSTVGADLADALVNAGLMQAQ